MRFAFPAAALIVSLLLPIAAQAASLSTQFTGGNNQVGNMFDVTVGSTSLLVTSLDLNINTYSGPPAFIDVYLKTGSYVGFDATPGAWTLLSSTPLNSANAVNTPTNVDVPDFTLSSGTTYGVYVLFDGQPNAASPYTLAYTNSNGDTVFSNSDLSLTAGVGKGGTFGPTFANRIWNGTINYSLINGTAPEPASFALLALGMVAVGSPLLRRKR